ncbi:MAG: erythromycin biosynthesis sensory transduction protein eryC1, partial [archaeon]|nr:erythromycin biosynthesis sensory transduction protein eryC1 [archaeon]
VDMDPILEIAHQHEIIVIEDCAQAHGSLYKNKKIGKIGDIGCFSFFPSKIMTVGGDGGMIVTENAEIAEKIAMLKNHGRKEKYKHDFIGTNTRLAEIPAAIGRIQLKHLQEFIELRQKIVDSYNQSFKEMKQITIPISSKWANTAYYVYTIQIDSREKFGSYMKEKGIATGIYYPIPVHKQPAILKRFGDISLPITEKIVERIISLPLHPQISKSELDYIID